MDSKTFEAIIRALDTRGGRRGAVRNLVGMAIAGAGTVAADPGAAARNRGKRRPKERRGVRQESGGPGNSACAHFCNAVFAPGRRRGQCKSEGARHVPGNLCDACESDVDRFCDGVCCAADETCDGSACQGSCPGTWEQCEGSAPVCTACANDEVCAAGDGCQACAAQTGSTACDGVIGPGVPRADIQCGPGDSFFCTCAERGDGEGGACIGNVLGCSRIEPTCETDADCETLFPDSGWVCVRKGSCAGVDGCVGDNICAVPCDFTVNAARRQANAQPRIEFAD